MKRKVRHISSRFISDQAGDALILVLIFLLLGSLILVPVLDQIGSALKTGVKYEDKSKELYAADAGIEDGIWQIKYDGLQTKFGGEESYNYDFTNNATYTLEDPVNYLGTDVTIQNIWIPSNVTLGDLGLSANDAKTIIESQKLVASGTSGAVPLQPYRIKIQFVPAAGDNLTIKSVGVWLPEGFTFVGGDSTLELGGHPYTTIPAVSSHCGGQAIVWSYTTYPLFTSFPNFVSENGTMTSTIYFSYTPPASDPTKMPSGIAWVTTEMTDSSGNPKSNDVPISWDVDTRIYKITSVAGNTKVEAYTSKLELRNMGDAAAGDYVAVGNSLMIDTNHLPPPDHGVRDQLLPSSDATVSSIPATGDVLAAYLYWSGWRNDTNAFSDTCSSSGFTNNWVNGGDWAYSNNKYQGQHTGADSRRSLTLKNAQNLSTYPAGTTVAVSWDQSVATLTDIFSDGCSSLTNWTVGSPTAWGVNSNRFRGQYSSGGDAARLLTLTNGQNLSGYSAANVSWSQWKSGTLSSGDHLYFNIYNGTSWSGNYTAGSSANLTDSAVTFNFAIPAGYFTSGFKIRFYLDGFGSGKYCYLDDIKITPFYTVSDGLNFALYNGTNWSYNIQAFRGPGNPTSSFSYVIPDSGQYLTSGFKFRFYLVGMGGSQQYCYLDNIKIIVRPPDNSVTFSINGTQVSLDGVGNPQVGGEVTASNAQVLVNNTGYSYACRREVTNLVKTYPIVPGERHHTGNARYTVGAVQADTGNEISYAGWSLIIVYFSQETAGHYLYLRDVFDYNGGNVDADFDGDGQPGGDISGFVIPEPIRDSNGVIIETNAAKLTCFVGEGDWCYSGDFIALNAPASYLTHPEDIPNTYKLWDGITLAATTTGSGDPHLPNNASEPDNVWNSKSLGMSEDGVDIDTFEISWASQALKPGDTRLHLDMYSYIDNWNLIYFIISVRSKTVIGGTDHYVIIDN